jgi:hypothetical protein
VNGTPSLARASLKRASPRRDDHAGRRCR